MNSSKNQHHISRNGDTYGPWTIEVIADKLAKGEITVTDFAWDEVKADWISLFEFAELKNYMQSRKPAAPPKAIPVAAITGRVDEAPKTKRAESKQSEKQQETAKPFEERRAQPRTVVVSSSMSEDDAIQWYVTRGQQKFGPFNYFGVVKALQDKSIFEFDYIWKEGMTDWIRLAEHEKFGSDSIRTLLADLELKQAHGEIFAKRRHPRMALENDVLVNDNQTVSPARMVEASAGGAGLIIKNSTMIPGQLIHLHFASIDGLPAFNAVGEIVSKKFSRGARSMSAPIHYGVRFVKMDAAAEERVKNYFKHRAAGRGQPASA